MSYVGNTTVVAGSNLGLVSVDEDPGVSTSATAAITGNDAVVSPLHRLLVNQLDSRLRLRLSGG